MPSLHRILKATFERTINPSIRVDRQPNRLIWVLLIISDLINFRRPSVDKANRFYLANKIPARKLEKSDSPPIISALVVSTRKDFTLLKICLPNLITASSNPIEEITVIVPKRDVDLCMSLVNELDLSVAINIIDEDLVIPVELRSRIKSYSGERYGWVLQQLLTVQFVLKSKACGILVVDSDTVLMQKLLWLDNNGNQLLMPSWEFNISYYNFLNKISSKMPFAKNSFISHHMLMQPEIFRAIFRNLDLNSIENLFELVEKYAAVNVNSPICLEFELYAQGMLTFFPQQVLITKWSNISLSRGSESKTLKALHRLLQRQYYRSVSVHSWSLK